MPLFIVTLLTKREVLALRIIWLVQWFLTWVRRSPFSGSIARQVLLTKHTGKTAT